MGCAVEYDTNGNYYCALKTDIVGEKLTQAAFKLVCKHFFY